MELLFYGFGNLPMSAQDDTALTFSDLLDSLGELDEARGSPKKVRRAFTRFVDLSQRLTASMRIDHSRVASRPWDASAFPRWTGDTAFLKWLRNEDQHARPINVQVLERQHFRVDDSTNSLVLEVTWDLQDQMSDDVPRGLQVFASEHGELGRKDFALAVERTEYQYLLKPRSDVARAKLESLKSADLHELALRSMDVLSDYHEFYRLSLASAEWK